MHRENHLRYACLSYLEAFGRLVTLFLNLAHVNFPKTFQAVHIRLYKSRWKKPVNFKSSLRLLVLRN